MARCRTFYATENDRQALDYAVNNFLTKLEEDGHTFVSMNTISFGTSKGYIDQFRTEVVYQENYTRKVITEKTKK